MLAVITWANFYSFSVLTLQYNLILELFAVLLGYGLACIMTAFHPFGTWSGAGEEIGGEFDIQAEAENVCRAEDGITIRLELFGILASCMNCCLQ